MYHGTVPPHRPSGAAETRNESEPIQRRNQEGGDVDDHAVVTKRRNCSAHLRGHNSADDDEHDTVTPDGDETAASDDGQQTEAKTKEATSVACNTRTTRQRETNDSRTTH